LQYKKGADDKLASSEAEYIRLKIITDDNKVDEVMQALDSEQLAMKSTDFKISPLLKGKAEYQKWQQSAAQTTKAPVRVRLEDEDDDVDDELEEWSQLWSQS